MVLPLIPVHFTIIMCFPLPKNHTSVTYLYFFVDKMVCPPHSGSTGNFNSGIYNGEPYIVVRRNFPPVNLKSALKILVKIDRDEIFLLLDI